MSEERATYTAGLSSLGAKMSETVAAICKPPRGSGYVDRETKERRRAWKRVREFSRGEREVL